MNSVILLLCFFIGTSLCQPPPPPKAKKECHNWTTPDGVKRWKCNVRYIYPNRQWSWRTVFAPDGSPQRVYEEKYSFSDESPGTVTQNFDQREQTTTQTTTETTTETEKLTSEEEEYLEDEDTTDGGSEEDLKGDTCGLRNLKSKGDGRIVGGRPALRNEFPWMVGIEHGEDDDYDIRGGGAIISKRWIVTAAHVFQGDPKVSKYRGIIDTVTLNEAPIYVYFDKLIFHPDYKNTSGNFYNDIALLHTTKDMVLYPERDGVNSICLPEENKNYDGSVTVIGFGTTDEDGTPTERLMTVDLEILNDSICRTQFKKQYKSRIMICAGSSRHRKDSCRGDSGGPLLKFEKGRAVLIGVVSYGGHSMCARVGAGAVYTKVSQYLKWIRDNSKDV